MASKICPCGTRYESPKCPACEAIKALGKVARAAASLRKLEARDEQRIGLYRGIQTTRSGR